VRVMGLEEQRNGTNRYRVMHTLADMWAHTQLIASHCTRGTLVKQTEGCM
jgi:hypothetical protein